MRYIPLPLRSHECVDASAWLDLKEKNHRKDIKDNKDDGKLDTLATQPHDNKIDIDVR